MKNSSSYSPKVQREILRVLPPSVRKAAIARRPVRTVRPQTATAAAPDLTRYRADPVGFAWDVLRVDLWSSQRSAALALLEPPRRLLVESGHNVGKTFLAAALAVWWYYTRPRSVVITTAPTLRDVVDLLWTEIRLLVARAGLPDHFVGPAAPEMRDPAAPQDHWAKGYTASKGESFQGRHRESMLFVFDEAEGLDRSYWTTTSTMHQPGQDHAWLAICNPTTTTSQRYQERRATDHEGGKKWNLLAFSALDHPNIAAGLAARSGEPVPLPYPNAVTVDQVEQWLGEWFEPVGADSIDPLLDVEYPPGSGRWWRPGPEGESRVLGRNPSAGTYGVWSESLWRLACRDGLEPLAGALGELPEIGCDVARYGDDRTEIHTRHGPCSVHHESHGGWDTVRTADRLMHMADEWAAWITAQRAPQAAPIEGRRIPIKVDDTGVGGGVTDILASNGYAVVPVNAGEAAGDDTRYPRVRDELWFQLPERARAGELDLSRLPPKVRNRLEVQALAPTWTPTPDRRRRVETKEETKKRIGRSPDGMDALNLAYYAAGGSSAGPHWIEVPRRGVR